MEDEMINSVKTVLDVLIVKEKIKTPVKLDIIKGSDLGDGYISKNQAVSIKGNDNKMLNLFIKYLPEKFNGNLKSIFVNAFQTERTFYEEIYPEFTKFQLNKNIKDPFNNVPKYYKTNVHSGDAPLIVMENLKCLNYVLRDMKCPTDDSHLRLCIKTFARYHAISYALRDQDFDTFKHLSKDIGDFLSECFESIGLKTMLIRCVNEFIDNLDPFLDHIMIERCKNLADHLNLFMKNLGENVDEYAVISQGDCRSNNLMFLYNDKNYPIDVKLIDWQCLRLNSPLLDFCYFFYNLASKDILDNTETYLNLYYETLCERIQEFGSDPKKLFPHDVFIDHWRKCTRFGLTLSFCIIKLQLFEKDEIPDFLDDQSPTNGSLHQVIKQQKKYVDRIKLIVQHFIDNNFI